jgi:hypothetical protein
VAGKSLPGVIGDDEIQLEVDNALFENKHVGSGKDVAAALSLSGADADNYRVNRSHTTKADITARPITVTADAKTKFEGEADPALTHKVTEGSLLDGDALAGGLSRDAGETPGSYAIKQGSLGNSDYEITYVGANLTIMSVCSKTAAFQAPIKDGTRNIVKAGNVIPVKLSFRDCNGIFVTGRTLEIRVMQGIVNPEDTSDGSAVIVESVSSADTTGVMRMADGQYMYNLSTKGLNSGQDYTIAIKDTTGSTWASVSRLATAVVQPKK